MCTSDLMTDLKWPRAPAFISAPTSFYLGTTRQTHFLSSKKTFSWEYGLDSEQQKNACRGSLLNFDMTNGATPTRQRKIQVSSPIVYCWAQAARAIINTLVILEAPDPFNIRARLESHAGCSVLKRNETCFVFTFDQVASPSRSTKTLSRSIQFLFWSPAGNQCAGLRA